MTEPEYTSASFFEGKCDWLSDELDDLKVKYDKLAARHERMRNVLYTTFVSGTFYHAGERAMILQILNDDEKEGKV